jgi:hypothetical protein
MRHPGESVSVSFSGNDRRLFQYRFAERHASGQLSESLTQRVRAILPSSVRTRNRPPSSQSATGTPTMGISMHRVLV